MLTKKPFKINDLAAGATVAMWPGPTGADFTNRETDLSRYYFSFFMVIVIILNIIINSS